MLNVKWMNAAVEYGLEMHWSHSHSKLQLLAMTVQAENGFSRFKLISDTDHIFNALYISKELLTRTPPANLDVTWLVGSEIDIWRWNWNPDLYLSLLHEVRTLNANQKPFRPTDWLSFAKWRNGGLA